MPAHLCTLAHRLTGVADTTKNTIETPPKITDAYLQCLDVGLGGEDWYEAAQHLRLLDLCQAVCVEAERHECVWHRDEGVGGWQHALLQRLDTEQQ